MSATAQPTVFYVVRHGETDWNVAGRMQGHADILLNENGRSQAMALGAQLHDLTFTSCYASDLKRAYHTAEIILDSKNPKPAVQTDRRLRERHFRDWEGKLFADFDRAKPEEKLNIEQQDEILARVITCLKEIAAKDRNGTVLILTHGGIIRNLLIDLLALNSGNAKVSVKNAGYARLIFSGHRWLVDMMHNIDILDPIPL